MRTIQECASPSAEPSPPDNGKHRGSLQLPHTAQAAGRILESRDFQRVSTFRLEPSKEQYALLKLRDAQQTQYMNTYSIHMFCERRGYRPPEDAEKQKLTSVDHASPSDLSSALYVAAQKRVKDDWARIGKRIWSGVQVPVYRKGCLRLDSGGRSDKGTICGVEIARADDASYAARLHVTAQQAEGDNWIVVPISRRTEIDERRAQLAAEFADGAKHILRGEVSFARNMTLLRVSYKIQRDVPVAGQRTATLSEFNDGRLVLRSEFGSLDFSSKLNALKQKKENWDGIRRRFSRRSMRSKGSARRLRDVLDANSFGRWSKTEMHAWSATMIDWIVAERCGFLSVTLTGADWPAHDLAAKLKYKAAERGIQIVEATAKDSATDRAFTAPKKLGDALREIDYQLGEKRRT